MKKLTIVLLSLMFLFVGCSTIQNLADQGMKSAEKAAKNYVDKETGSGTFDDMMAMKSDKQKTEKLLPYFVSANKLYDEKQITEVERDEMKKTFDLKYNDFVSGKLDEQTYDKECTEMIEKCQKKDQAAE